MREGNKQACTSCKTRRFYDATRLIDLSSMSPIVCRDMYRSSFNTAISRVLRVTSRYDKPNFLLLFWFVHICLLISIYDACRMSQFLPAKRCSIGQDKEKMLYYIYMSLEASLKNYNKKKTICWPIYWQCIARKNLRHKVHRFNYSKKESGNNSSFIISV